MFFGKTLPHMIQQCIDKIKRISRADNLYGRPHKIQNFT